MSLPEALGIDTNCFVYLMEDEEESGRRRYLTDEVFGPMSHGRRRGVTSTVTLAELLVPAHRLGASQRAVELRAAVEAVPGLEVLAVDSDVAADAAELRGRYGGTLPDAIQVAVCRAGGADALLTNDRDLRRFADRIEVLILDETRRR